MDTELATALITKFPFILAGIGLIFLIVIFQFGTAAMPFVAKKMFNGASEADAHHGRKVDFEIAVIHEMLQKLTVAQEDASKNSGRLADALDDHNRITEKFVEQLWNVSRDIKDIKVRVDGL